MPKINWMPMWWSRANRVRKLCETEEYVLIHEERQTPNFGRAANPEDGKMIRIHYDPVERILYKEEAYQNKPSTWEVASLPPNPDDAREEDDDAESS